MYTGLFFGSILKVSGIEPLCFLATNYHHLPQKLPHLYKFWVKKNYMSDRYIYVNSPSYSPRLYKISRSATDYNQGDTNCKWTNEDCIDKPLHGRPWSEIYQFQTQCIHHNQLKRFSSCIAKLAPRTDQCFKQTWANQTRAYIQKS
jgi:hypothetical protein